MRLPDTRQLRLPMGEHERALIDWMVGAHEDPDTPLLASLAIEKAFELWHDGRSSTGLVDADADPELAAWAWFVRMRLLEGLSAYAPPDVSLARLQELGDATPGGWLASLKELLPSATVVPRQPVPDDVSVEPCWGPEEALSRLMFAYRLGGVGFEGVGSASAGVALELRRPDSAVPELWLVYATGPGRRTSAVKAAVNPGTRRAFTALVAGLRAVDAMALGEEKDRRAREIFHRAIASLAAGALNLHLPGSATARHGRLAPDRFVGHAADSLLRASPPDQRKRKKMASAIWPFAAVAEALERFAGAGGEPLHAAPAIASRVQVLDRATQQPRGHGTVLEVATSGRRPAVTVKLDGSRNPELLQWHMLRTAPRAQLLPPLWAA